MKYTTIIFKWDNQLKEEYLSEKPTKTAQSNAFVLRAADEYEFMAQKSIYNLSIVERDELIAMQFKNSSPATISKNVSILSGYIQFCITKGLVAHHENRFSLFTQQDANRFSNKQAFRNKYVTEEQLKKYIDLLYNNQDKLLLWLPFIGVRGRTEEGATLEEIINLQIDPKSEDVKNNKLLLVRNNSEGREITVDDFTMELVIDTYKAVEYIGNNGEETLNPKMPIKRNYVNHHKNYVFRCPGKNKFEQLTPALINSRMHRIQGWIDNKYLTMTSIYESGMIHLAKQIIAEKGEITIGDYIDIASKFAYGDKPERYVYNVKQLVDQYLEVNK